METRKLGFGEIITGATALLQEHLGISAAVFAVIAAGYSAIDLIGSNGANFGVSLAVSIFGQYAFTQKLLADRMPVPPPKPRYGALLAAAILSGLGIVLGLMLLILPGIYLLARWSMVTPFVVAEGEDAKSSLRASWRATEPSQWPILGVYALCGLVLLIGFGGVIGVSVTSGAGEQSLPVVLATNVVGSAATVASWILAAAIYRLAVPREETLREVFA